MRPPGIVTRNLKLKAVAAALATITWAGVVYASNPPDTRTVSVHVPQDAPMLSPYVLVHPVNDVQVRVSGTREHLSAFDTSAIVVTINYHVITQTGVQQIPITVTNNDRDVLLDSAPSSVTVEVDHLSSRSIPVTFKITQPPAGYTVGDEAATPPTVTVIGPENQLAGIKATVTADLSNIKTNFQQDLPVVLFDSLGHAVRNFGVTIPGRTDDKVQVTIAVTASITSRASAVLPRITGSPDPGHQVTGISVSPATVVLSGPQDLLNTLDSVPTQLISLNGVDSTRTFIVVIQPPAGVTATPTKATVTVTVLTTATPAPAPAPTPTPSSVPSPSPS